MHPNESLGLVSPSQRTPGGYREYSDADIGRIFHIEGLRKLGMSLTEVGRVLSEPDFDPGTVLGDLIAQARERIAAEQRLLDHLQSVARLGRADGESLLYTIDLMRSLESGDVIQRHKAALGSGVDGGMPIEALSQAVLQETVLNAAGAMRWALAQASAEAVPHVVVGMDDASAEVRRNALLALDEIRRTTPDEKLDSRSISMIRQALDKGLDDVDPDIRSNRARLWILTLSTISVIVSMTNCFTGDRGLATNMYALTTIAMQVAVMLALSSDSSRMFTRFSTAALRADRQDRALED